jgi:hypothetical protein
MGTHDDAPKALSSSKPIRLFEEDDTGIEELHAEIKSISGLNIQDIIRQCVHVGLPIIKKRWEPLIKEKKG